MMKNDIQVPLEAPVLEAVIQHGQLEAQLPGAPA
jgi:hypothetical protein